jgi:hypothetical protein
VNTHPNIDFSTEPQNFLQAITHPGWNEAIKKEITSVLENKAWKVVNEILEGKSPIHVM